MPRPRRILVIRPDRIGDVAVSTPVYRALRQRFPDAFLAVLLRPSTAAVLQGNPRLDAILIDDYEHEHAGRSGFINRLRMLRSYRFDTALMLLPSERHAWMTFLAGIPFRVGVGRKLYQTLTWTRYVSRNKYIPLRHEADYCLDLARRIGADADDISLELFLDDAERSAAHETLRSLGRKAEFPLIGLHPESGGSAPNWPSKQYVELAALLLEQYPDIQILPMLTEQSAAMLSEFTRLDPDRIIALPAENHLRRLMTYIDACNLTVSASTGPMHLAAGLGVATVNLFCPIPVCSPELWGPRGNRAEIILPSAEYCGTLCPGDPKRCTFEGGIDAARVAAAVLRLLKDNIADSPAL
jgi:heptosyltransferase III